MKRKLEIVGLLVFAGLMIALGVRVVRLVDDVTSIGVAALAATSALLFTDFISALVHWFCDTYFEEDTTVIGPALIFPFREHHRDPMAMTYRDTIEINNSNALAVIPFLLMGVLSDSPHTLFGQSWLFAFGLAVYSTNTVHKWTHDDPAPALVNWMQRHWMLMSPTHHRKHHVQPSAAYGITTGWVNPVLDSTRFFRHLEALVGRIQGTAVRRPD
ncbi:MAG: hypothetical protein GY946_10940 [bacterium]|nr:hypothetical protein [bacterium]